MPYVFKDEDYARLEGIINKLLERSTRMSMIEQRTIATALLFAVAQAKQLGGIELGAIPLKPDDIPEEGDWIMLGATVVFASLIKHFTNEFGGVLMTKINGLPWFFADELAPEACGFIPSFINAEDERPLIRLICEETDRICGLVDHMEQFADGRPIERGPVNIYFVLEHVRRLAESGFARHVRFAERYDPSLPNVDGNRDQLVQVFLNLIKNAAEAVPREGGEVRLSTQYTHGLSVRVANRYVLPGSSSVFAVHRVLPALNEPAIRSPLTVLSVTESNVPSVTSTETTVSTVAALTRALAIIDARRIEAQLHILLQRAAAAGNERGVCRAERSRRVEFAKLLDRRSGARIDGPREQGNVQRQS